MAMLCSICGDKIHLGKEYNVNGKLEAVAITCPLGPYKSVKTYYSPEFKGLVPTLFSSSTLANTKEGLTEFGDMIPESTPLTNHVQLNGPIRCVDTTDLVIETSLPTFVMHYSRLLIDILYARNGISYVDCNQEPTRNQFNYLWLTPSLLREILYKSAYEGNERFKSLNNAKIPSLLIYPLGVEEVNHRDWGDVVQNLLTSRASSGLPTWIIKSKEFSKCQETNTSNRLRPYLEKMTKVKIEEIFEEEAFVPDYKRDIVKTYQDTESKEIRKGNEVVRTGTYI